jgi:stearoyl-CoA desaturase (delta-9 desaturase)
LNLLSSPRTRDAERAADLPPDAPASPKPLAEQVAMAFTVFLPPVALIAAIVLLWGRGIGWVDLALMLGLYAVTGLSITIGWHRLFTHRAFRAAAAVRAALAVGGSMAAQGPVLEWCATHRQHHKHSDRDGDPHSPHLHGDGPGGFLRGLWHAHMGWLFVPHPAGGARGVPDLLADPILRSADRLYWFWVFVGWAIPAAVGGLVAGSWFGALTGFLWGGLVRQGLLHHTTFSINSACHVWGSRPFRSTDESRNNVLFGLLTFGEGWHNNHHAFPTSARHGLMWYQLDVSWLIIRAMQAVGLAWDVRLPSGQALEIRRNRPADQPFTTGAAAAASAQE